MSALVSLTNTQLAEFEEFIWDSKKKYDQFMNQGLAYTPLLAQITRLGDTRNDKVPNEMYLYNALDVINYYNPNFRTVVPNVRNTFATESQTAPIVYLSVLGDEQNTSLLEYYSQFSRLALQVAYFNSQLRNEPDPINILKYTEFLDSFLNAFLIGFSVSQSLTHLAIRFSVHSYTHYTLDSQNIINKVSSRFDFDEAIKKS